MVLNFEITANLSIDKFISDLGDKWAIQPITKHYTLKTFYDSFDWRLWRNDLTCEFNRSKTVSTLIVADRKQLKPEATTTLFDVPAFANQFNPGKVKQLIQPHLGIRALLAIGTVECEVSQFNILDEDGSIAARLIIEEFALLNNRLTLLPYKGYEKLTKTIAEALTNDFHLSQTNKPLLLDVLQLQGRRPKDYSAKISLDLLAESPADETCKIIFNQLLRVIKLNEQGVIADIDSEFLHDFRVAVRKTRVGLSLLKTILPDDRLMEHREFFNWLGQISGETRDVDVYLLNFDSYKKQLPKDNRQSINPLQAFLTTKKTKLHKQLAQKLQSKKYKAGITKWQTFVTASATLGSTENHIPEIKVFADQKIWQLYKRVIKQAEAIDRDSPPEVLHRLRKSAKKLRYILEFFQSLYPAKSMEKSLDRIKALQDVLGDYQDIAMQQARLQLFSEEMQKINTPTKTFLAMGFLINDFESRKRKTKDRFAVQFEKFQKSENRATYEKLFKRSK